MVLRHNVIGRPFLKPILLAALLFATPLFASHIPYSIAPASGPKSGGTTVVLRGTFGPGNHEVYFGSIPARPVTLLDEHTLSVVTPAHFRGNVDVIIVDRDRRVVASLPYEYTGNAPLQEFERLLLPVFIPPVQGAFGSEFRTYFRASAKYPRAELWVFGLTPSCRPVMCLDSSDDAPLHFNLNGAPDLIPNGTPGRFVYVPKEKAELFTANLRAADTSRSAQNFGTELPVVRESDFSEDVIVLHDVPTDARFRNTLRVYAGGETNVSIEIQNVPGSVRLDLRKTNPDDPFEPAYGVFTDFPVDRGQLKVTITGATARGLSPPIFLSPIWGFISVTNNDTQMITTISAQP